jgi:hypothetical protein
VTSSVAFPRGNRWKDDPETYRDTLKQMAVLANSSDSHADANY